MRTGAYSGSSASRWRQATALALLALLLLPVNYRAGAAAPHPHALILLVWEAREGIPVHHHGVDQIHGSHGADVAASPARAPAIQVFAASALLPLIAVALLLPSLRLSIRLEFDSKLTGRSPAPGHPPPKPGAIPTVSP